MLHSICTTLTVSSFHQQQKVRTGLLSLDQRRAKQPSLLCWQTSNKNTGDASDNVIFFEGSTWSKKQWSPPSGNSTECVWDIYFTKHGRHDWRFYQQEDPRIYSIENGAIGRHYTICERETSSAKSMQFSAWCTFAGSLVCTTIKLPTSFWRKLATQLLFLQCRGTVSSFLSRTLVLITSLRKQSVAKLIDWLRFVISLGFSMATVPSIWFHKIISHWIKHFIWWETTYPSSSISPANPPSTVSFSSPSMMLTTVILTNQWCLVQSY